MRGGENKINTRIFPNSVSHIDRLTDRVRVPGGTRAFHASETYPLQDMGVGRRDGAREREREGGGRETTGHGPFARERETTGYEPFEQERHVRLRVPRTRER